MKTLGDLTIPKKGFRLAVGRPWFGREERSR